MKTKVLVVDDDDSVRESIRKVLRNENYDVLLAADGSEVADRYEAEPVDLLLLDVDLPIRSGWEPFNRFAARHPGLPIIVLTGHADQYQVAVDAGVSAFMEKPLDVSALLQTIRSILAEPPGARVHALPGQTSRHRPGLKEFFENLRARPTRAPGWRLPSDRA